MPGASGLLAKKQELFSLLGLPKQGIIDLALNNRHFVTVLKGTSPRSRCWQGWFLWRPFSLACHHGILPSVCLCPYLFLYGLKSYWIRAMITSHFHLIASVKALSPKKVTL